MIEIMQRFAAKQAVDQDLYNYWFAKAIMDLYTAEFAREERERRYKALASAIKDKNLSLEELL